METYQHGWHNWQGIEVRKYALEELCEQALTSKDALDDVEIVDWSSLEDAAVVIF